jgi:serine/threonine protein kinase
MKELNSEHIVKLIDHFEDKEYLYMVMEYCN